MKRLMLIAVMCIMAQFTYAQTECEIAIHSSFEASCLLSTERQYLNEMQDELIACKGSTVYYTAEVNSFGETIDNYQWSVTGGSITSNDNNGTISIKWSSDLSVGTITVKITTEEGGECRLSRQVTLIELPTVSAVSTPNYTISSGQKVIYVCYGESVEFTNTSSTNNTDIVGHFWSSIYSTESTENYKIDSVIQNTIVRHYVFNNCGCESSEIYEIRVLNGEKLELECYGTACEGSVVTYRALNPICTDYNWYIEGGHILNGQGTPIITVVWDNVQDGYGIIGLDGIICSVKACPKLMTVKIPIIQNNIQIDGQTDVCVGEGVIYSVPLWGATEYEWQVTPSNGVYISDMSGQHQKIIQFTSAGTYTLTVKYKCPFLDCGTFASHPLIITVKPKLEIVGKDKICITNPGEYSLNPNIAATWRIFDITNDSLIQTIPNTNQISYNFTQAGSYRITASNDNFCSDASFIVQVKPSPNAPTLEELNENNPTTACKNSSILLQGESSNPTCNLVWKPSCSSATPNEYYGNEVTISYGNDICNLEVYTYDRVLGCKSADYYIHQVSLLQPEALNIPSHLTVCPGTSIDFTDEQVPYQEGMLYEWTIQPDMQQFTSIQGDNMSNSVQIFINNSDVIPYPYTFYIKLKRKYCESFEQEDYIYITVSKQNQVPLSITHDNDPICPNATEQFIAVGGQDDNHYKWFADGMEQPENTKILNCSFSYSGNHDVKVIYNNYNYCNNSAYYSHTTDSINVRDDISIAGITHSGNTLSLVPQLNSANYSFQWYFNGSLLQNEVACSTSYISDGIYNCIITDLQTGCTKDVSVTIPSYSYDPNSYLIPDCSDINLQFVNYNICSNTLTLKANNYPNMVSWCVSGLPNNKYTLNYTNLSGGVYLNHNTANININTVGTFYIYAYTMDNSSNCYYGYYAATIDFIPIFYFEKACNKIIIHNKSKYLDKTKNIYLKINGNTITLPVTQSTYEYPISSDGTYNIVLSSYGTYNNNNYNCSLENITFTSFSNTLNVVSYNTLRPYNTCDNTPLRLQAVFSDSTQIDNVTWTFSDGTYFYTNSDTIYHTFAENTTKDKVPYLITASAKDENGCYMSGNLNIKSYTNKLQTGYLFSDIGNNIGIVCPYTDSVDLKFISNNSSPEYAIYMWSTPPTPNSDSMHWAYYTDDYFIRVLDTNYCKEQAMTNVPFLNRPSAIVISDKKEYCYEDTVYLFGSPGPNVSDYTYEWMIYDEINHISYPRYEANPVFFPPEASTYTISLSVYDSLSGCSTTATDKTIPVYPKPTAPNIGFGNNMCINNPPVDLITTGSPNVVYWSNGVHSNYASYFYPGVATAHYYDQTTGCKSNTAQIYIEPAPNMDAILSGCYQKCINYFPNELNFYGITTQNQNINWRWILNSSQIYGGSGIYASNPLYVQLTGFGSYHLLAAFAGNCSVQSNDLTIKPKTYCDCEDNISIRYTYQPNMRDCHLFYDINITLCNTSESDICISSITPMFNTSNSQVIIDDCPPSVPVGGCITFHIRLEITNITITNYTFRIFDECNNCEKFLTVELNPDTSDCEKDIINYKFMLHKDLSNSAACYFDFVFDVSPAQNILGFSSDYGSILNYVVNGSIIQCIAMFDIAELVRLASNNQTICFYAIVCNDNILCKIKICINSLELLSMIISSGIQINAVDTDETEGKETETKSMKQTNLPSSPVLIPNPVVDEVNVEGLKVGVTQILIMDMQGKPITEFENTKTFSIASFAKGSYIVRIKDENNNIWYLKLIKQ